MFRSSPGQMSEFIKGNIWADINAELEAWIKELQEVLSDPDGPKDIETISLMRGSIKACRNFQQMPGVLVDNMDDDNRHEKSGKTNWR